MAKKKKQNRFKMPSAFTVLLLIIVVLAIVTNLIRSDAVTGATLPLVVMSPVLGFIDALDVALFVMIIGGFLGVINKTEALQAGIAKVVEKFKGKENVLIPVLMFLFSIGGTTYGMAEETIAFYALIVGTMMLTGFDSLTGAAVILLGAGVGVLGSTVNPFAIGAAIDALPAGVEVSQAAIISLGAILWISSYLIATFFVMRYAKKVKAKKSESILSKEEIKASEEVYLKQKEDEVEGPKLTVRRKLVLGVFAFSFVFALFGVALTDGAKVMESILSAKNQHIHCI